LSLEFEVGLEQRPNCFGLSSPLFGLLARWITTKPDSGKDILCLRSRFRSRQEICPAERHLPGSTADVVLHNPCAGSALANADTEPAKLWIEEHPILQPAWKNKGLRYRVVKSG
jgi:hypothetical protein